MRNPVDEDLSQGAAEAAKEIAQFLAFLFFTRKNKMSSVAGKLASVQYFHRRVGAELSLKHFCVQQVKSGLARESALHGGPSRIRRPVSWVMLKQGIGDVPAWGKGGRVLWLTLAVTHFFMCGASEMYASSCGKIHKEFGLTRGDVEHLIGDGCVTSPAMWQFADSVFGPPKGTMKKRSYLG